MQRELHRTFPSLKAVAEPAKPVSPPPKAAALPAKPAHEAHSNEKQTTASATASDLQRQLEHQHVGVPEAPPLAENLQCAERLAKVARYTPLPERDGPGECGATGLVQVDRILMPDQSGVALIPAPILRCAMAEQFAQFVRDDIGPAAIDLGSPLMSITDLDSYTCRPRNNVKGAKTSEHGKGNAIDIKILRLRNGGVFDLTDKLVSKPFRERVRAAACDRFKTILGPGSDGYHANHIHLDIAERSHGYRICEWDVFDPTSVVQTQPAHRSAQKKDQKQSKGQTQPEGQLKAHGPARTTSAKTTGAKTTGAKTTGAQTQDVKTRGAKVRDAKRLDDKARDAKMRDAAAARAEATAKTKTASEMVRRRRSSKE